MGKRILMILLLIVFLIAGTQIAFAQEDKLIIDISVDQPIFADYDRVGFEIVFSQRNPDIQYQAQLFGPDGSRIDMRSGFADAQGKAVDYFAYERFRTGTYRISVSARTPSPDSQYDQKEYFFRIIDSADSFWIARDHIENRWDERLSFGYILRSEAGEQTGTEIKVYLQDKTGKQVATLHRVLSNERNIEKPGAFQYEWNLKNEQGKYLTAGDYTVVFLMTNKWSDKPGVRAELPLTISDPPAVQLTEVDAQVSDGQAKLEYCLNTPAQLTVTVTDEKGCVVRHLLTDEPVLAGAQELRWDLTNDAHRQVADGTYTFCITAENANPTETVTMGKKISFSYCPDMTQLRMNPSHVYLEDGGNATYLAHMAATSGQIDIEVLDERGRLVRILAKDAAFENACFTGKWDFRNDAGEMVSLGKYYLSATAKNSVGSDCAKTEFQLVKLPELRLVVKSVLEDRIYTMDSKAVMRFRSSQAAEWTATVRTPDGLKVLDVINGQKISKGEFALTWNTEGMRGIYQLELTAKTVDGKEKSYSYPFQVKP